MFEYYKWRLANKQVGKPLIKSNEKEPLRQMAWMMMLVFATSFAMASSLATFWGMPVVIASLIVAGVSFVWMILELLEVTIKNVIIKLLKALAFLVGVALIWGLVFGTVNMLAHLLLSGTRSSGLITNNVEIIMWLLLLATLPLMIILFFRFMDGRKIFGKDAKIHRKTYFELLITLIVGALLTYYPNGIVLRTLFTTRLVQFILLALINAGMFARLITTCRNRGVL